MSDIALTDGFYDDMREELKGRVSEKRLAHIDGVAATARQLALVYGADEREARIAGLLHDWDKGMDDAQIRERVRELDMGDEADPWVVENMPQVLHGPTAAKALHASFPEIPDAVIDAIRKHTIASADMSDLAKIIYIADAIEPSRRFDIADELRASVGKATLDDLYFQVYKFWTIALLEHDRPLHPDTISIWNSMVGNDSRSCKRR